jgi:hypothetical protein
MAIPVTRRQVLGLRLRAQQLDREFARLRRTAGSPDDEPFA